MSLLNSNILVDDYLIVESDLSIKAFHNSDVIPLSTCSITDTRLLESILSEIYEFSHQPSSYNTSNTQCTNATHISTTMEHIQQATEKVLLLMTYSNVQGFLDFNSFYVS